MKKTTETINFGYYDPILAEGKEKDGKIMLSFSDSTYTKTEKGIEVKRQMSVGRQPIIVRSFFHTNAVKTPTQQMLNVIDSDFQKKVA